MKLSQAFGDTSSLRIKSFVLANKTFKVRVPLSKEMEDMQARIEQVYFSNFYQLLDRFVDQQSNNHIWFLLLSTSLRDLHETDRNMNM